MYFITANMSLLITIAFYVVINTSTINKQAISYIDLFMMYTATTANICTSSEQICSLKQ